MRLQKRRPIEDLADREDTDPSWAQKEPDAIKVAPQAFVGTSKTIMTSHPSFIEIKYKVCGITIDTRIFNLSEKGIRGTWTRSSPHYRTNPNANPNPNLLTILTHCCALLSSSYIAGQVPNQFHAAGSRP